MRTRTSLLEIDIEKKEQSNLMHIQRIAQLQADNERYKKSGSNENMDILI